MAFYNKTFNESLTELLELSTKILPNFTSYEDTDPLVILIKLIASMSVSSNKYSNKYLNSKFVQLPTLSDTRSRYLLLQTFNMSPNKVIPGTIEIIYEYTGDTEQEIFIPEGSEFLIGDNEISFTIFNDYYVKAYNQYVTLELVEGEYIEEEFYDINISNNRIELESESVAIDYVKVFVDGEQYTKIQHADLSKEVGVFSVEYDMNHHYNIVFSDETVSKITETSEIIVDYIESTGTTEYNPLEDDIVIESEIIINEDEEDEEDVSDNFKVNTIVGYTIGDTNHNESNNYERLSLILSTFRQAITTLDYENLTNEYPGIAISAAYDFNDEVSSLPEINIYTPFLTKIVAAPVSGYYMTDQLKENLMNYLRLIGLSKEELELQLIDPDYIVINISIGVGATTENQSELLDIYSTVNNVINEYFKVGNIKFGSYITKDYISSIVARSDDRIDYVEILEFNDGETPYYLGYQLNAVQLPLLGNLNIVFNYRNISLSDSIQFNDVISSKDITYYLQGSRGENMRLVDNNRGITHELGDSANFKEDHSFGYYSDFDIELSQSSEFVTRDQFSGHRYSMKSSSNVSTIYLGVSRTDTKSSLSDTSRDQFNSLITDRSDGSDIDYNY